MMLDVVVRFQYCGHRGRSYVPASMKKAERRLRITVDESRSAGSIRSEVVQRNVLPKPYQYLGGEMKSQNGFELDDKDMVRYVSSHPACYANAQPSDFLLVCVLFVILSPPRFILVDCHARRARGGRHPLPEGCLEGVPPGVELLHHVGRTPPQPLHLSTRAGRPVTSSDGGD